jgi:hypothetical protein
MHRSEIYGGISKMDIAPVDDPVQPIVIVHDHLACVEVAVNDGIGPWRLDERCGFEDGFNGSAVVNKTFINKSGESLRGHAQPSAGVQPVECVRPCAMGSCFIVGDAVKSRQEVGERSRDR